MHNETHVNVEAFLYSKDCLELEISLYFEAFLNDQKKEAIKSVWQEGSNLEMATGRPKLVDDLGYTGII